MTTRPTRSNRRSPLALGLVVLVLLGALAAAGGLAYLFLRDAPPPAVGLATGSPGASAPTTTAGTPGPAATTGSAGTAGTWTIDSSIGSFADFSSSFVGYRVNETFTDQRANTAVGRTPGVSGTLALAGSTITNVEVTADLTRLQSDKHDRDVRLREQALETDWYTNAIFRLTSPIELGSVPAEGGKITATARGELMLHGVTKPVEVPIQAQLHGDVVSVTGSIEILFDDYGIDQPTSFLVLSIEDHGIMEFQLHFRRG